MPSKVLLAGSDRMLQQMANTFDAGQIHTVSANDGYEALCLLNETTPDVLIAEIALSGKDGYALCLYIRQEPEFQSLPVILLDDRFDSSNRSLAFTVGADVYLNQPFQPDELIDIVYKLLESKAADDEKSPSIPASATPWQEAARRQFHPQHPSDQPRRTTRPCLKLARMSRTRLLLRPLCARIHLRLASGDLTRRQFVRAWSGQRQRRIIGEEAARR